MKLFVASGCLLAGLTQALAPTAFGQPKFTLSDLGTLGGNHSEAHGINASGQVTGYAAAASANVFGFRTAANSAINPLTDSVGGFTADGSLAFAINDAGQVVGYSNISPTALRAYRTGPNAAITPADDLGIFPGFGFSEATGINSSGQVVGNNSSIGSAAFRTAPNQPINVGTDGLGSLGGTFTSAHGINDSGQAVGQSERGDGAFHAYRTAPNALINALDDDLGSLGGGTSIGYAINNSGQVVGQSSTGSANHAFRTAANAAINPATDDLGTLGNSSEAHDINSAGDVVGYSNTKNDGTHAFLYTNGKMYDLNSLIPNNTGWTIRFALGINDAGQIAATAHNANGDTRAVRLDPVGGPAIVAVNALIDEVIAAGLEDKDEGRLINTLESTRSALQRGNLNAAGNHLDGFIRQVESLVDAGKIGAAAGADLIAAAQAILASIS